MRMTKALAIGFLVGTLGFSTAAMAAGKNAAKAKSFDLIGSITDVDVNARVVTVKDSYSGKLYSFYVAEGFKMPSQSTLQHYLNFEQLQPGIVVNLRVQETNDDMQARVRK